MGLRSTPRKLSLDLRHPGWREAAQKVQDARDAIVDDLAATGQMDELFEHACSPEGLTDFTSRDGTLRAIYISLSGYEVRYLIGIHDVELGTIEISTHTQK